MGSDKPEEPVEKIGEKGIIRELFLKNVPPSPLLEVGPGDDAAVFRQEGKKTVVTTDMLVEDVHFDLAYHSPELLGEKSIRVSLSDIAAMGATPLAAFIAVGMPSASEISFVRAFALGLKRALRRYGVILGGGDTVRADKFIVSATLIGELSGPSVTRRGAKMGDSIYISGIPGLSHLGFLLLKDGLTMRETRSRAEREAMARHLCPEVDVSLGRFIQRRGLASAMIDTSDGIYADLGHILEESEVGATIDLSKVPVSGKLRKLASRFGNDWVDVALFGGEDYHLLFTVKPEKEKMLSRWSGKTGLYKIGSVDRKRGIYLDKTGRIVKLASRAKPFFEHFSVGGIKNH